MRRIVGENVNVCPVLKNLVEEGRLGRVGANKYAVAAPMSASTEWIGRVEGFHGIERSRKKCRVAPGW